MEEDGMTVEWEEEVGVTTVPQGQLRHKIIPKIDANFFGILLVIFAEYNINYFSKLSKSKDFLLLTIILLTV